MCATSAPSRCASTLCTARPSTRTASSRRPRPRPKRVTTTKNGTARRANDRPAAMRSLRIAALPALLLLLGAADLTPADYAADAQSIEKRVNEDYAYLDRFPGQRMPMTAKLRGEAAAVRDARQLIRFSERALSLLADHHAITGSSLPDSWAVFPTYADLWVERRGTDYVIEQV